MSLYLNCFVDAATNSLPFSIISVVANHPIPDRNVPILSFGEDEDGEVYYLTTTASGRGIMEFRRAK